MDKTLQMFVGQLKTKEWVVFNAPENHYLYTETFETKLKAERALRLYRLLEAKAS